MKLACSPIKIISFTATGYYLMLTLRTMMLLLRELTTIVNNSNSHRLEEILSHHVSALLCDEGVPILLPNLNFFDPRKTKQKNKKIPEINKVIII